MEYNYISIVWMEKLRLELVVRCKASLITTSEQ